MVTETIAVVLAIPGYAETAATGFAALVCRELKQWPDDAVPASSVAFVDQAGCRHLIYAP